VVPDPTLSFYRRSVLLYTPLCICFALRDYIKFKGIRSISFLKNGLKKFCRKNYKNHPKRNNYEVCTAVARYFLNILDVMVLENINLSSDKIGRPPLWSNETDLDTLYRLSAVCTSTARLFHMYMDLEVFNFIEKITCFAFYLMLWTECSTCQSPNFKRRWLDLFCNYYHIQCVCNHSTALVVIFVVIYHSATSKILSLTKTLCL
jgi:hypothetical protein